MLAAVAAAFLGLAAPGWATPPPNDDSSGAIALTPTDWTKLQSDKPVFHSMEGDSGLGGWGDASVKSEDKVASCLGETGFRSFWYAESVSR